MQRRHAHTSGGQRLKGQHRPRSGGQQPQNAVQPKTLIRSGHQQHGDDWLEGLLHIVTREQPQQRGGGQVLNLICGR